LVDDREDFRPRVDSSEFVSYRRHAQTIGRALEHGSNGFVQRLGRWFVGPKIDPNAGPFDARVDVGLVFGQPSGDKRNAKAHRLIDAAVAAVGDEYVDLGQRPFERQILGKARVAWNWARNGIDRTPARGCDDEQIGLVR
jgi:hypothetical protein